MSLLFKRRATAANVRNAERGFTLIELLIVVSVIALLATMVGPSVMRQFGQAKSKTAKIQIANLSTALDAFRVDTGRYPTSDEGLKALIERPGDLQTWNGPYLAKKIIPQDPWNRPYEYRMPGEHADFDLWSLGADGAEGGEGENADVNSWE